MGHVVIPTSQLKPMSGSVKLKIDGVRYTSSSIGGPLILNELHSGLDSLDGRGKPRGEVKELGNDCFKLEQTIKKNIGR